MLRNKTALVVDDDVAGSILLQHVLECELGCKVKVTRNGKEARDLLEAGTIDIVFSDLSMPHCDGWEIIEYIRGHSQLREMPVIAVTAHVMKGDRERVLNGGFDGFLGKPFLPHELEEKLHTIFLEIEQRKAKGS